VHQALSELVMQASGGPFGEREAAARYLNLRKLSIYGGTNEIQRNIVAKQILGL
jgi:alkylation response protein AidB-like acyl-CoA dehydrogenase